MLQAISQMVGQFVLLSVFTMCFRFHFSSNREAGD